MKEGIASLAKALVAAQAEMKNPGFDSQNPHFRSKFASLAAVRNAVIPIFNKHGIFVTQAAFRDPTGSGDVLVTTYLIHESGEWIEYPALGMPVSKGDAQGVASASTYGRRYGLQTAAGVVGDEDDDGEAAVDRKGEKEEAVSDAATTLADKLAEAVRVGIDQQIFEIAKNANEEDVDLYQKAWRVLPANTRKAIKDAVNRVRGEANAQVAA